MASKLHTDQSGAALLEFAVVFPLAVLVILGTVEASLLMLDWAAGTKATYLGARVAVVSDPVADGARFSMSSYTNLTTKSGAYCVTTTGTTATDAGCPTVSITCTGNADINADGTCTSGTFNKTAFKKIFDAVQRAYIGRKLDPQQVQVSYVTTDLGFVGQQRYYDETVLDKDKTTGELPLNVTVSLRCMQHQFYFIGGLLRWAFPAQSGTCSGITTGGTKGMAMPNFYTTLPSEDLSTNTN